MSRSITILQLYTHDMNIYGDWGNVLTVLKRAKWYGIEATFIEYNPGDTFPKNVDIIIGGGGQDKGQDIIQSDLQKIKPQLEMLTNKGTPMLVICGMYQLFGRFFKTREGKIIEGIGLLDIETHGGDERLIGNIVTESPEFGKIIGYENHSGQTFLGKNSVPLATVIKGAGNNGNDASEGARYKNIIGSYLHGSLLPKNPAIADWLIERAVTNKYGDFIPTVIDDRFAHQARDIALGRPR